MKEKNVKFNIVDLNTGTVVKTIVQPLKDYYNKQQQRSYNTRTTNMIKNMNVVITDNGVPINQEQFNQPRVTPTPEPKVDQSVIKPEVTKVENQEQVSEEQEIPVFKFSESKEFKERLKNLRKEDIEIPNPNIEPEIKNDEGKIEEKDSNTIIEKQSQDIQSETTVDITNEPKEKPDTILTQDEISNFFNVINKENEDNYRRQQNRKFNKYTNNRKNKKGKQNRKSSYTSYSEIKENNDTDYSDLPKDVQETIKSAVNQYDYSEYENQPTHEKIGKNKKGGEY